MTIRIGAGPLGWFEDDFSAFRDDIAREARMDALARAGFDGLSLSPRSDREVAAVWATLARHRLHFIAPTHAISLTRQTAADEFAILEPHIRAAGALGAECITVAETVGAIHLDDTMPLSQRPTLSMIQWVEFGERLSELASACSEAGIRLVYRPHMGTIVQTPSDIDQLMAATHPSVGLLLDAGHVVWGGGNPAELARRYASRIAIVEATDVNFSIVEKVRAQDLSYQAAATAGVFMKPGTGCVDTDSIFNEMPHFTGWTMRDETAGVARERVAPVQEVAFEVAHIEALAA